MWPICDSSPSDHVTGLCHRPLQAWQLRLLSGYLLLQSLSQEQAFGPKYLAQQTDLLWQFVIASMKQTSQKNLAPPPLCLHGVGPTLNGEALGIRRIAAASPHEDLYQIFSKASWAQLIFMYCLPFSQSSKFQLLKCYLCQLWILAVYSCELQNFWFWNLRS